jgi:hypothetical protein
MRHHSLRLRNRPRTPANQKVRMGLRPTATTMIHRTQVGRPSTASSLPCMNRGQFVGVMVAQGWAFDGKPRAACHPRGVATPAGSPRARSRPGGGATFGRRHNARWSSQAIRRAERTASAGLTPATTARIDTAQSGRLSIARCPPSYWQRHLSHDLVTGSLTAAGRLTIAEISRGHCFGADPLPHQPPR